MDSELKELNEDIELVRLTITRPFYLFTVGLGLLVVLPLFSQFPDYGITYWEVWGVIGIGFVARIAGEFWISARSNRRLKQRYPEMFTVEHDKNNRTNT